MVLVHVKMTRVSFKGWGAKGGDCPPPPLGYFVPLPWKSEELKYYVWLTGYTDCIGTNF